MTSDLCLVRRIDDQKFVMSVGKKTCLADNILSQASYTKCLDRINTIYQQKLEQDSSYFDTHRLYVDVRLGNKVIIVGLINKNEISDDSASVTTEEDSESEVDVIVDVKDTKDDQPTTVIKKEEAVALKPFAAQLEPQREEGESYKTAERRGLKEKTQAIVGSSQESGDTKQTSVLKSYLCNTRVVIFLAAAILVAPYIGLALSSSNDKTILPKF